jgi:hypothetical protein
MALPRSNPATFQWNVTEKQNRNIPGRMSQLQQTLRDLTNLKKQEGSGFRGMLGTTAKSIGQVAERGRQQQEKQDLKDYEEERLREQRTYQEGRTADQRSNAEKVRDEAREYAEEQEILERERLEGQAETKKGEAASLARQGKRDNLFNTLKDEYGDQLTLENKDEMVAFVTGIINGETFYDDDPEEDEKFKKGVINDWKLFADIKVIPGEVPFAEIVEMGGSIQDQVFQQLLFDGDITYHEGTDDIDMSSLKKSKSKYISLIENMLNNEDLIPNEEVREKLRVFLIKKVEENIDLAEFSLGAVTKEDSGVSEYSPGFGETPAEWKKRMIATGAMDEPGVVREQFTPRTVEEVSVLGTSPLDEGITGTPLDLLSRGGGGPGITPTSGVSGGGDTNTGIGLLTGENPLLDQDIFKYVAGLGGKEPIGETSILKESINVKKQQKAEENSSLLDQIVVDNLDEEQQRDLAAKRGLFKAITNTDNIIITGNETVYLYKISENLPVEEHDEERVREMIRGFINASR